MEYVIALLVLAALGYFVFTRIKARKNKTSGSGGSGGGGRNTDGQNSSLK